MVALGDTVEELDAITPPTNPVLSRVLSSPLVLLVPSVGSLGFEHGNFNYFANKCWSILSNWCVYMQGLQLLPPVMACVAVCASTAGASNKVMAKSWHHQKEALVYS